MPRIEKSMDYKGYDIKITATGYFGNAYFAIYKDNERLTILALASEKACKNVIDTHERFIKEEIKNNLA